MADHDPESSKAPNPNRTTQPQWASRLLSLLDEQRVVYYQLREFSQKQSELVEQGDADHLMQLLAQRQQLIDRLSALNQQLEPFKKDWPRLWSELDEPTRRSVDQRVNEVQALLDGILKQDDHDRKALIQRRDNLSSGLKQVSQGQKVNRAYGSKPNYDNNRYTDSQG